MQTAEYEIMYRVEQGHWWYQSLHALLFDQLERYVPGWQDRDVLDAGCGTGAVLQRLGNPLRHRGVDLSPEAIRFCRERGLDNVLLADVASLPFASGSFDAVICANVLYHCWVRDVPAALDELIRVLRPGGCLLLILPAFRFLHSAHDEAVLTARRFTRAEVRSLLREKHLAILRLTYWTALFFPLAWLARTLGVSKTGRDFRPEAGATPLNGLKRRLMSLELSLLKHVSLPVGVSLSCVARRTAESPSPPG